MDPLTKDVRFALRMIRNSPAFTAAAVLTLALGIGGTTAIFSFVDAVLLKPLPFPGAERILNVWEKPPGSDRNGISTLNFLDWKNQNTVFTAMAAQTWGSVTLTDADVPVELRNGRVSAPYFEIFGAKPMLGRTFAPDEDQLGKQYEVILSHRVWQSRFGADGNIIGRSIRLNGAPYTVIGVMRPGTFDREWQDVWTPLAFRREEMTRDYHWMISWARLKPGVTLEQAREQMKAIAARIERAYPQSNKGWSATVDRYQDRMVDDRLRRSLLLLLAAVGAVLLIGCVNLANLLLVRGAGREREVAIRSALGAGRGRLVCQFLTESVLLAGLGGSAGIAMGWGLMLGLKARIPPFLLPAEADVALNGQVLLFAAAIVIVTGILFGIAPALHSSRADLVGSLKEGGRGTTSALSRMRVRNVLAVAEIALAFILLSGAALLVRSFYRLQQVDPGFDSTNVITMQLPMTSEQYPDGPRIISYLGQVLEKLRAVPGVRDAATTGALPLEGWPDGMPFLIEGRSFVDIANRPDCGFKPVSPSYLSALGMRLVKGRWLAESDTSGALPVTVINATMAKRDFKDQDPIVKRILIQQIIPGQPALGPEIPWQVVGVVADEKAHNLEGSSAGLYVSYKQSPSTNAALVVRGAMDPTHLIKSIETAIWQLNKNQALDDIKTLEQIKSDSLGDNRLRAILVGTFAALALLLAAIGVYGVISYSVAQRTHEIGVRAALGASHWDQLSLVLKTGMSLTAAGLAIGVLGALGLTHLLSSLLFGVSPRDPGTLLLVSGLLATVAATACYIPAHRAARVDPAVALRHE
ncbi:MAG TPA: ABC transporter permease [Bryobacteraceae bacterium]|nr:ABC transporter permease [Bryobacteraceae bacterium]